MSAAMIMMCGCHIVHLFWLLSWQMIAMNTVSELVFLHWTSVDLSTRTEYNTKLFSNELSTSGWDMAYCDARGCQWHRVQRTKSQTGYTEKELILLCWVARQCPRAILRQSCTCWVPSGDHGTYNQKLSLSQNMGCTAEAVTQSGMPVHPGWVARDWRTFCHLGIKSAGTLSRNPTLSSWRRRTVCVFWILRWNVLNCFHYRHVTRWGIVCVLSLGVLHVVRVTCTMDFEGCCSGGACIFCTLLLMQFL